MLLTVALAAAATVAVSEPRTVKVDGREVTYIIEDRSDGTRRIVGTDAKSQPFEFVSSADGKVQGSVGIDVVRFRVGASN